MRSQSLLSGELRARLIASACALAIPAVASANFSLTLLHNNDGESKIRPVTIGGQEYAGAANFVSVVKREEASTTNETVLLSSGDNFLAGSAFSASLANNTFYDAVVINNAGYDALALGNHDFDFGPDVLEQFIQEVDPSIPFLAANIDVSNEPGLQNLANAGRIKGSHIVTKGGEQIGIIGALTPELPAISSPRNVVVNPVLPAVQAEVTNLQNAGVDKIVLITHLQDINEELSLIPQLSGVDVVIAGGGSELLATPTNVLIPGDTKGPDYPLTATDFDGNTVPVVTTTGEYKYLGRLEVDFDTNGQITDFTTGTNTVGGAIRVSGNPNDPDFVAADTDTFNNAQTPVDNHVAALAANVIATTNVELVSRRGSADGTTVSEPGVRTQETNWGNVFADALLWQGQQLAGNFGVDSPVVALQNGGGIRNNSTNVAAGDISELLTFDAAAFNNFVTIIEDIPVTRLKQILEHSVTTHGSDNGRFGQWAGVRFTYDPSNTAQQVDIDGNITGAGDRIIDAWIMLESGELQIIDDGVILDDQLTIDFASIDFLVRTNGDRYPFTGLTVNNLGVSYQQALANYLEFGLGGVVSDAQYPIIPLDDVSAIDPGRRIDAVPEPSALSLLALAAVPMIRRRRQRA